MKSGFNAIELTISIIIIVIAATILGGSSLLGSAVLGSFTGFVSLALIVPTVLVGKELYRVWRQR